MWVWWWRPEVGIIFQESSSTVHPCLVFIYLLAKGLPVNLEATRTGRLSGKQASGILLSLYPPPVLGSRVYTIMLGFYVGARDPKDWGRELTELPLWRLVYILKSG